MILITFIQLRLEAYDSNNPNLRAEGLSFITVIRNPATPRFEVVSYDMSIEETQNVGFVLLTINATDDDGVSFFTFVFCSRVTFNLMI